MKKPLTITAIKKEAGAFAHKESKHHESALLRFPTHSSGDFSIAEL